VSSRGYARWLAGAVVLAAALGTPSCAAASPPPAPPITQGPPSAAGGQREIVDPALTARVRKKPLLAQGTPLPVGALAPDFAGRPALAKGQAALVLFYRGHW
jgi:hypothetical protein